MTYPRRSDNAGSARVLRARKRRPETGDTLLEVLFAVLVLGITSTAILLAFGTSIFGSSEYRSLATTDTVLRTAAEEATNAMQGQATSNWMNCTAASNLNTAQTSWNANPATGANVVPLGSPGYTVTAISATYWNGVVYQESGCPNSAADPGSAIDLSALVSVTVTTTAGVHYSISTVANDPGAPAVAAGAGPAAQLAFTTQPVNGTSGNPLWPPPVVAVENSSGDVISTDDSNVTLTLVAPSDVSGATLSNCASAPDYGTTTFNQCTIDTANSTTDGGYALVATDSTALPGTTLTIQSNNFNITANQAAKLAFTTSPSGTLTGGTAFGASSQPVVQVEDAYGNVVPTDTSTVTLSIAPGTGAAGAALSGCSNPSDVGTGNFNFQNCAINTAGSNYELEATDATAVPGVTLTATSNQFNVVAGAAAGLTFSTAPSFSNTNNIAFSTQPVVSITDAGGNNATSGTSIPISLSLVSGTGSGTLTCTTPPFGLSISTTSSAQFLGCKVSLATQGTFTLKASATINSQPVTATSPITVAGSATKLAFQWTPQPSSSTATFASKPTVVVEDSSGDIVSNSSLNITIENAPTAIVPLNQLGTLGCSGVSPTPSMNAASGVAAFSNCEITVGGTGGSYTLYAFETGNASINTTSASFPVAGAPTKLVFQSAPGSSSSGAAFTTQPIVDVEDAHSDLVTNSTATVNLLLSSGSGAGALSCPSPNSLSIAAVGGVATFSGCEITLSGSGGGAMFSLGASSTGGLTGGPTASFSVAGPAYELMFTGQPSSGFGGVALTGQPQLTVYDQNGYVVTDDSSSVSLHLNVPVGTSSSAALSDNCVGTENAGVIGFAGCSVNVAANGYTLTASGVNSSNGALVSATSSAFNIAIGTPTQLVFSTSPNGGAAGQAFGTQPVVQLQDAGGNVVPTGSIPVRLSVTGGAPITCTTNPVTTVNGVATFAGCSTTTAGTNITLSATSTGYATAISQAFTVTPGLVSELAITSSPVSGAASATPTVGPITVQEEDAYGNPVVALASNTTVSLSTTSAGNPSFSDVYGGTSSNTVTIPYGYSSATFYYGDEKAASPIVTVSSAGLSSAAQVETIVPAPATQLFLTPTTPFSGAASATANIGPLTVQEQDPFGNPSPAGSGGQAVALSATGTGTFSPTLGGSGAATITIPAGATSVPFYFGDETVGPRSITASAFGTQATQSGTIASSIPSATVSTVVANPTTNVGASTTTGSTVTVTLEDAFGNPVANKVVSVTPGAGSSVVTAISATTNSSGVATFTASDTAVQTVTYTAKDTTDGITLSTKPTVGFIAGPASSSASNSTVMANPTSVSANGTSTSTITVTSRDAYNNPEIGDTITLSAGSGSSLITTLSGTTNSSGQATFSVSDNAAQAVSYTATDVTDSGVIFAQTPTVTFVNDPASAANSTAVASPTTGVTANGTATSIITVTIKDGAATPLPISNQTVTLTQGSGSSVIAPTSATTNSSGVATFTVTDTHAQTVTYTATDTTENITVATTPTVAFVAGLASASTSTVVANPTSLTVSNATTSLITVTALDAHGNPEVNDSITLTPGSGNFSVITTSPTTTNSSGVATFTVKDTHAQAVAYTATDTTDGVILNPTPTTVTFVTGTASASASTVRAASSPVKANGESNTTITVTATDVYGNPEVGDTVTLTDGVGSSVIATSPTTTNSSGVATFTVTDNAAQTVTYTATDTTDNVQIAQTATVTFSSDPMSTTKSTAVATPTSLTANGTATSLITVTINDATTPTPFAIANQVVTLSGTGSSLITTLSGTTNSSGQATFSVSDTTAQTVTYTATDQTTGLQVSTQPTVAFVVGPASPLVANSTVVASPTSQLANGTSLSTVTVTAKDANNNPEIGDTVTLSQGGGSSLITTLSGTTNSSGQATFSVADNATQAVTYTATDTTDGVTLNETATVTFTSDPPSAANSSAQANPTGGLVANGASPSTITVTIDDASTPTPYPIANQTVSLTQGSGASVITPTSATTNSLGKATFTVTDTTAQTVTYTATDTTAGVIVGTHPTVAFVAGPASASTSTVVANPTSQTANGTLTSTITVTALDAHGNPELSDNVTLTASPSTGSTITTSPTTTNSSGVAIFTVKDTHAGVVSYTATDTTDGVTLDPTPTTVTFVPGLASASVSTAVATKSTNVTPGNFGGTTITVTINDANGNPIPNQSVTLTANPSTGSTITTSPTTTNSSGVAIFTVKDSVANQTVTYTATDTTGTPVQVTPSPTVAYN
jgi:hypothetical protein